MEIKLCKKCTERGDYTIINYKINEEKNKLEYYCITDNELNSEDLISYEFKDNLKYKLKYCKNHKNNRYCGWCNDCKKNICYLCIIEEKHNYILFCDLYPSIKEYDTEFKNILKELFLLRIDYNLYSPGKLNDLLKIIKYFFSKYKNKIIYYK